jgi:hypothetical protein
MRDGSTVLTWADDDYCFRLGWAEIEMLQEATDMGPWLILDRLRTRTCKIEEISETMRCGLIGGGIEPVKAKKLVDRYVKQRPPAESILHAFAILTVGLQGAPEEGVGETEAASETAESA